MASCSLKKTGQVSNKLDENSIEFVFFLGKNLPCDSILWGASIDSVSYTHLYIYYLLLLALSISCTANKKGIDKRCV